MNINDASVTASPVPAAGPAPSPKAAERLQLLTLVQQFEGMLLTEMMRDVRAGDEEEEGSFGYGAGTMNATMQGEFGMAMSRAGGLGMGEMLAKALNRQQDAASSPLAAAGITPASLAAMGVPPDVAARALESASAATATAPAVTAPVAAGFPGDAVTVPTAAVTSEFGWRSDPLNGQLKFHNGADLRMAYGSDVRAAAAGVVASAGEKAGYGLTVVVDHGDGRETRYAHLSTIDVSPGETVGGGQLIARSGNSGRTTGPHLHFEAREYGKPVDPRLVAAAWTGRKSDTAVGDSDEIALRY